MNYVDSQKNETHCHTKISKIIVNGREKLFDEKTISFVQVVELAFCTTSVDGNTLYTVSYSKGSHNQPKGIMVKGDCVKVKSGMIFNVTATDKS